MTPHRYHDRGTLVIDKIIKGVGRIRLASGTKDKRVFKLVVAMFDGLRDQGRLDLITAIRTRKLTPLQVYSAYRLGELERLPTVDQLIPLVPALATFAEEYECSDKHRQSLWTTQRYIEKHVATDATVPVLPDVVRTLRVELKDTPRMFNVVRSVAMAFARSTFGKGSKLWLAIAQTEPLKVTPSRVKHPASVAELLSITSLLPTEMQRDGKTVPVDFAGMVWTLALTGMRTDVEYFDREWSVKSGYVEIGTGKKDKAVRRVPLVRAPVAPGSAYKAFREALHAVTKGQMTPYDLRRTYANWLEAAGVPRTRRFIYMGHGQVDITGRYEWHEVKAFLAEDGAKVTAWLDAEIAKATAAAKPKLQLAQ